MAASSRLCSASGAVSQIRSEMMVTITESVCKPEVRDNTNVGVLFVLFWRSNCCSVGPFRTSSCVHALQCLLFKSTSLLIASQVALNSLITDQFPEPESASLISGVVFHVQDEEQSFSCLALSVVGGSNKSRCQHSSTTGGVCNMQRNLKALLATERPVRINTTFR